MKQLRDSLANMDLRSFGSERWALIAIVVFILSVATGFISGVIFRKSEGDGYAASANITVVNNDQTVDHDQSTNQIVLKRTSEVRVTDPQATTGYLLAAKLIQNNLPAGTTITIGGDNPQALHCTIASPCTLDQNTNATGLPILYPKNNNNATLAQGDTSMWEVTITVPANADIGNYIVDIAYSEEAITPMQTLSYEACTTERKTTYDARNSQTYYIQRLGDTCWMESNLRYGGGGDNTYSDTKAIALGSAQSFTEPLYYEPGGDKSYVNVAPAGGFYGFLYNWCAAMGNQTNACNDTSTSGFDTTTSICPAGWRLPGGGSTATSAGNEFGALNTAINNGSTASSTGLIDNFFAVYSGDYTNSLNGQGNTGYYWSSTSHSGGTRAYGLSLATSDVYPGTNDGSKYAGRAVRCVKGSPPITAATTMQQVTKAQCDATPMGAIANLQDTRDGTYYRVKKMADGRCWMVDNLALDLTQNYTGRPSWGTAPVKVSGTTASVNNVPQIAENNNTAGQGQIPNNGSAKASYLYNWCAALADTSSSCSASVGAGQYNTVTAGTTNTSGTATSQPEVTGICPAPFRLPKGGPEAISSNPTSTANEFVKLDITIGGTGVDRTGANTYTLWAGTATADTATTLGYNWSGVLAGYYNSGFSLQGSSGNWWSSTASSGTLGYDLGLNSGDTYVGPVGGGVKYGSRGVRCLL